MLVFPKNTLTHFADVPTFVGGALQWVVLGVTGCFVILPLFLLLQAVWVMVVSLCGVWCAGEVLLVAVHCNQMLQFRKRTLQSAVFCVRHSACVWCVQVGVYCERYMVSPWSCHSCTIGYTVAFILSNIITTVSIEVIEFCVLLQHWLVA